ncbi:MAG: hypothetical protein HY050_09230 [Actinobacteria bacterium]|nr:hypothetical protein [Actinomycetota bacterium]MBI3774477.1 hypothetical protein [Gammaproteobacteria bacterium]
MKKLIVIITLIYTVAAVAALGFISNWFRDQLTLGESVIVTTLVLCLPTVLILAVIAYWNEHNQWFTLILVVVILGSSGYVIKTHHDAYGVWLPSPTSADVETSGTATFNVNGQNISYRLELHNPGTVAHREFLIVTRGGQERRIRLPVFDDARSGYVNAKTPSDWIVLQPTADTNVVQAETGRFLFVRKSFRVNLRTGEVTALAMKSQN